jgi:ribonuclease HII
MAATYDFTPANGGANVVGTLETTGAVSMFLITVKNDSNAAIDLRAVDGVHGSVYDLILRELQPIMAHAIDDGTGVMSVLVDSASNTAASLQSRIRGIAGVQADNDSTVVAAASFAASA